MLLLLLRERSLLLLKLQELDHFLTPLGSHCVPSFVDCCGLLALLLLALGTLGR